MFLRRRLLLVSNSDVDFAEFVMHVSLGANWRELFDLVVFAARKGRGFFELPPSDSPFLSLPNYPACRIPLGHALNSAGRPLSQRGPAVAEVRGRERETESERESERARERDREHRLR